MKRKIFETVQLVLLTIILPLLGNIKLLWSWPILFVTLYGILLNMSQPAMNFKAEKSGKTRDRYSMHAIFVGAILCFVIPIMGYAYGRHREILLSQAGTWVGMLMIMGGFLFRYWSIRVLGKFFSSKVQIQSDHQLIQEGPYKYLRHPSYTGAWVANLGVSMFLQSRVGLVFCIFVYFPIYIYRIMCEEKALVETFPESYGEYQKKTYKMFPFLH